MTINLTNYFKRIGFTDEAKIDIETLEKLNFLHAITIPFENLNPFLKLPVSIEISAIETKLVTEKRGGYCYEHNTLFQHVLSQIGFDVRPLAGRVVWNDSIDSITSLTHMFLLVTIDENEYLVDVGFGAQTLTAPIKFNINEEQKTPHECYQIIRFENDYVLQTKIHKEWKSMYRFNKNKQHHVDFEVGNWYTSTNPDFIFTNILYLSKAHKNGRISLINTIFKQYDMNGKSETINVESVEEIKKIMVDFFGIRLPEETKLDEKLNDLFQKK